MLVSTVAINIGIWACTPKEEEPMNVPAGVLCLGCMAALLALAVFVVAIWGIVTFANKDNKGKKGDCPSMHTAGLWICIWIPLIQLAINCLACCCLASASD